MKQVQLLFAGQLMPVYQGQMEERDCLEVGRAIEERKGVTLPLQSGSWLVYGAELLATATFIVQERQDEAELLGGDVDPNLVPDDGA